MTLPDSTLRLLDVAFDEALAVARELMNSPNPHTALRAARTVIDAEKTFRDRAPKPRPREYVVFVHDAPSEPRRTPPALPGGTT